MDTSHSQYVGKKLMENEIEDITAQSALKFLQDIANSPWEQTGITKEQYASQINEIEEAAKKHDNDIEPSKVYTGEAHTTAVSNSGTGTAGAYGTRADTNVEELKLPKIQNEYMTQLIFHDFDYVDENNNPAQGHFDLSFKIRNRNGDKQKRNKSNKKKKSKRRSSNSRSPSLKHGMASLNDRSHQTLHPDMGDGINSPTFYDAAHNASSREGSNSFGRLNRHRNNSGKLLNGDDEYDHRHYLDPEHSNINKNVLRARRRVKERRNKEARVKGEVPFIHFFNKNKYGRRKLKKHQTETPLPFFGRRDQSRKNKKLKIKDQFNLDFNSQYEPRWLQKERYKLFDKIGYKPLN